MGVRGKLVLVCILGILICSCNLFMVSEAVWLNLPASGTKCVSEEIHNNVVVLADYVVVSDNHSHIPSISVKVTILIFFFLLASNFHTFLINYIVICTSSINLFILESIISKYFTCSCFQFARFII